MADDYNAAAQARRLDTATLSSSRRFSGAMHLGGSAVECRLKAYALAYHQIAAFKDTSAVTGKKVPNPSHDLLKGLKAVDRLYSLALQSNYVLQLFETVSKPDGSNATFIDQRYRGDDVSVNDHEAWSRAWTDLMSWLDKHASTGMQTR